MSSSQLATYNSCTSRSGYTYSAPLQQPVQSVSLMNNSYGGIPNSISGESKGKWMGMTFEPLHSNPTEYYLPQSTTSPSSLSCSSGVSRRFDTNTHPIGGQFYNWEVNPSRKMKHPESLRVAP